MISTQRHGIECVLTDHFIWFSKCLPFLRNDCDQVNSEFSKHQVRLSSPLFSLSAFLTGAPLDTIYIDNLFCTFRQMTSDPNGSFYSYSPCWKVFLEWRLALRKTLRSILFKSVQSFFSVCSAFFVPSSFECLFEVLSFSLFIDPNGSPL